MRSESSIPRSHVATESANRPNAWYCHIIQKQWALSFTGSRRSSSRASNSSDVSALQGDPTAVHRRGLRIEHKIFVADLLRQPERLIAVRRCSGPVVGPIVGEPGRREQRTGHARLVALSLGCNVGRLVGVS